MDFYDCGLVFFEKGQLLMENIKLGCILSFLFFLQQYIHFLSQFLHKNDVLQKI